MIKLATAAEDFDSARPLSPAKIGGLLTERFGMALTAVLPEDSHPRVHVEAAAWRAVAEHLRHTPALALDWLSCLTALDYLADGTLCVAYDLWSFTHRHAIAVKVYVPRATPTLASVADLWPAADWHEREAYDMIGIRFTDHPDPRRILLADDWIGHPLRKDYVFPRAYHGIPASVELDWQQNPAPTKK